MAKCRDGGGGKGKICELVGKVTEIEMKREVFRKEVLEETGLGR